MSYPPDPNNPYAQQPPQQPQPPQPGYGYPQQPPAQPQYGYPQQGAPQGAPQDPYAQDPYAKPPTEGYGYPQQGVPPQPGYGGYQPDPYGQAGYGGYGQGAYASWGARVGAYIIDALIVGVVPFILYIIAGAALASGLKTTVDANGYTHVTGGGVSAFGVLVELLGFLIGLAGFLWLCHREGTTGQSPGKKILNIRLIREADGQVTGFGLAVGRKLLHVVDSVICYIGFLWPLWDPKSQTLADKIVSTVVVKTQ